MSPDLLSRLASHTPPTCTRLLLPCLGPSMHSSVPPLLSRNGSYTKGADRDRPMLKRQAEPAPAVIVSVSPWQTKVKVVVGVADTSRQYSLLKTCTGPSTETMGKDQLVTVRTSRLDTEPTGRRWALLELRLGGVTFGLIPESTSVEGTISATCTALTLSHQLF
jgi:hypothetical protein